MPKERTDTALILALASGAVIGGSMRPPRKRLRVLEPRFGSSAFAPPR